MGVVAVIVTHDSELDRFKLVLDRASEQVDSVIVVNDFKSKGLLRGLCSGVGNCDFVKVVFLTRELPMR